MFLYDYFFGSGLIISALRVLGGPFLCIMGFQQYTDAIAKDVVGFSVIVMMYGFYMILRPFGWFLSRLGDFASEQVSVEIVDDALLIRDEKNESKIDFDSFVKMDQFKSFFSFSISKSKKIRVPKRILSPDNQSILMSKILDGKS